MNFRQFCPRNHDTHVTGRYNNGVCKECSRERGEDRTAAGGKPNPNKFARANPIAALIPTWVPHSDKFQVPCSISTGWHKKTDTEQATICRGCPLKTQCRETGAGLVESGEIWGGVRMGAPDHERWHDGTCLNGHKRTPENTYKRAGIRRITDTPPVPATQDYAEFNRWLNQVKADAWDEGHDDGQSNEHEFRPGRKITNTYREDDQ